MKHESEEAVTVPLLPAEEKEQEAAGIVLSEEERSERIRVLWEELKTRTFKDEDEVYDVINKIIEVDPNNWKSFLLKARVLNDDGYWSEAVIAYDQAIRLRASDLNENDWHLFSRKGVVLVNLGRVEEGIAAFDQAINIAPNETHALTQKGSVLFYRKRYEEAIAVYNEIIARNPEDSEAFREKGEALYELGRLQEAIPAFEKALELYPYGSYIREKIKTIKDNLRE